MSDVHSLTNTTVLLPVKWIKPHDPFYKLNCDGSAKNSKIGAGGLIRDSNGNWVIGFSKFIGTGQILKAELWRVFSSDFNWQKITT